MPFHSQVRDHSSVRSWKVAGLDSSLLGESVSIKDECSLSVEAAAKIAVDVLTQTGEGSLAVYDTTPFNGYCFRDGETYYSIPPDYLKQWNDLVRSEVKEKGMNLGEGKKIPFQPDLSPGFGVRSSCIIYSITRLRRLFF